MELRKELLRDIKIHKKSMKKKERGQNTVSHMGGFKATLDKDKGMRPIGA